MSPAAPPTLEPTPWWKSSRFWFFALPFATGALAACVPPLWVASKVDDSELKARPYAAAGAAAVLALIGGVLVGSAPPDAAGNSPGPRDDIGVAILLVAIGIGTWTAVVNRLRVSRTTPAPTTGDGSAGTRRCPGCRRRRRDASCVRNTAASPPATQRWRWR